ncbi:MAG: glycosyltransferase N-terminal domain-containing protein [Pseudomonadota bacterium]
MVALIYRLLLSLAAPLILGALIWRVLRGQESWTDLHERLGLARYPQAGPVLWVHGASNGELTAAKQLVETALEMNRDLCIVITSNTTTARNMVRAWDIARVHAQLAPLDMAWAIGGFLKGKDVRAFWLLEADFWPGRHLAMAANNVPVGLVSARISAGSARAWARLGGMSRLIFSTAERVWPQDAASAERFRTLGVPGGRFGDTAELKSGYRAAAATPLPEWNRQTTWLAASTHEGEDTDVLDAHQLALESNSALKLILAPRHPKRGDAIEAMITDRGFDCHRRSRGDAPGAGIYLADTLGEMPVFYASSAVCFVAGSLVPKGGHTPFEPVSYGCAIVHGPHTENFSDIYQALEKAGATFEIKDARTLADALISLANPELVTSRAERAKQTVAQFETAHSAQQDVLNTLKTWLFDPS